MKIPRTEEDSSAIINISSLLDVMFILIIFFLATTTFEQQEHDIAVNLPQTAAAKSPSDAPRMIIINVRQDGSYNIASRILTLKGVHG